MNELFFRLDSNEKNGLGHFSRCFKLVSKVKNKKIFFLISKTSEAFFKKKKLKYYVVSYKNNNIDEKYDAEECLKILKQNNLKKIILIKDQYQLSYKWEKIIYNKIKNLVVIDDHIDRNHYCKIYINQSITDLNQLKYINTHTKYLVGKKYLMINKKRLFKSKNKTKNFLIYFGGSDKKNLTLNFLSLCQNKVFSKYNFKFIMSSFNINQSKIISDLKFKKNIKFLKFQKNLDHILIKTDFFVGSVGMTLQEALYHGIPSLAFPTNKNHNQTFKYLSSNNFIFNSKNSNKSKMKNLLLNFIKNHHKIKKYKIDGLGLDRIKKEIYAL